MVDPALHFYTPIFHLVGVSKTKGGFSLGPNVGEAVNFATHDWIAHGSEANERYRSFARPAVFSHDRLTFTMAAHLKDQKLYRTCKLLLHELERVVAEELSLRRELISQGVRDVSDMVSLPQNRLDQLDEESADYDDKRLCHGCKHVCFFSAVACECSQSKVSCLRHSHYMCRCAKDRRYLLTWTGEEEMKATLDKVRQYCQILKSNDDEEAESELKPKDKSEEEELPETASGVAEDLANHERDSITFDPVLSDPKNSPSTKQPTSRMVGSSNPPSRVTSDESTIGIHSDDKDSSDDDNFAAAKN